MNTAVAELFMSVCRSEVMALKPGNVHVHAAGHGMTVEDFLLSAEVAAPEIARAHALVGDRILRAAQVTRAAVGCNTNLGILLLCAPLARAAELPAVRPLRDRLCDVLAALTVDDAEAAFEGIRLASPGGLGQASEHDVAGPATVNLREAMTAARSRDRIAAQYADDYRDIFDIGVACARPPADRSVVDGDAGSLAEAVYLDFLTAFPNSHILRKHGEVIAAAVLAEARELRRQVAETTSATLRREHLFVFDAKLKWQGINPGASADLTVASLFAYWLEKREDDHQGTQA